MNKEQIIGEVYENYFLKTENTTLETLHVPYQNTHLYGTVSGPISNAKFRPYTQEEFINKCKTDTEFSEKWGLKIEERELSLEEELEYMMGKVFSEEALTHQVNIPTRLITITYNKKTIESYE